MAVSVAGGQVRPHLYEVGDTRPRIEVPAQIDADELAKALNAILNGEIVRPDEVTAFTVITAAAFAQGIEHGRSLAEVS